MEYNDYHTKSRVRSTSSIFQSDQVQTIDPLRWVSEHQNVTSWMSPWPQWGLKWCDKLRGKPAATHIGKWEDWGEGVQWYDPGQWGWPGHGGRVIKYTVFFISHTHHHQHQHHAAHMRIWKNTKMQTTSAFKWSIFSVQQVEHQVFNHTIPLLVI